MRKFLLVAAIATSTLAAAPAFAQDAASPFSGARAGVVVGTGGDDIVDFDGATIGVDVGYDWDLGGAVFGIGAEYQTDLGDDFFDVNETALLARLGAKLGENALVYATGGYTHLSSGSSPFGGIGEDGIRVGAGVEFGLGNGGTALKIEQRYLDYGNGANAWQTAAGLSFRF